MDVSDAAFVALARFIWRRVSLCDVIHSPILQLTQIGGAGRQRKSKEPPPTPSAHVSRHALLVPPRGGAARTATLNSLLQVIKQGVLLCSAC